MTAVPTVDVSALVEGAGIRARHRAGLALDAAWQQGGFCLITGHGVAPELRDSLEASAREFFGLPEQDKAAIAMARAGSAWRGWFPVGGELTSGRPDGKEGIYFGTEATPTDPRVAAGTALHGANLFPGHPVQLRSDVLTWIEVVTQLGQSLLEGLALALGLPDDWFARHVTADPTVLFRIFHYPPTEGTGWGVGEHTDYGLLTLLAQDEHGGLQVRQGNEWIDVPADRYAFVVNCGDMLDRMTRGRYRSAAHRVRNVSGAERLSFPLFLDPSWDATVVPLPDSVFDGRPAAQDDADNRWDRASVHAWDGTYGEYLTAKVARVFPELFAATANTTVS